MPAFFGVLATVVLGAIAIVVFGVWGFPFTLVIAAVAIAYVVSARKRNGSVATVERGRTQEPTGMPRKAPGGAETANERIGQV